MGLDVCVDHAADVAVFMHSGGLWAPCLWLETETNPFGYLVCWHTAEEMGQVSVPPYFKKGITMAKHHGMTGDEMADRICRVGSEGDVAIFRDRKANSLLYGPKQLTRH